MKCINCKGSCKDYAHPTLEVCSFECLKQYRDRNNIAFKPLDFKLVYSTGRGKNKQIVKGEDKG
jgi:hypothetical protein